MTTRLRFTGKREGRFVLIRDRRNGVGTHIESFIHGEAVRHLFIETAFPDYFVAHVQRRLSADPGLVLFIDHDFYRQHVTPGRDAVIRRHAVT